MRGGEISARTHRENEDMLAAWQPTDGQVCAFWVGYFDGLRARKVA